jgi:hypothetical protein
MVEFSLGFVLFLGMVIGLIDLGRVVYQQSAASQAAREIARVTSVHPGSTLGSSSETAGTVAAQRALVPGLSVNSYVCVDITGAAVSGRCLPPNWVRVSVTSRFDPALPLLVPLGSINLTSASSAEIE